MATPASVASVLETAVIAGTSATAATTNREAQTETLAAGATKAQILTMNVGQDHDSNVSRLVAEYDVRMLHRLSTPLDDSTYLDGNAVTDQGALMVRSFYRALAGVHEVIDGPGATKPSRPRPGNVIEYTVTVQLSIVP